MNDSARTSSTHTGSIRVLISYIAWPLAVGSLLCFYFFILEGDPARMTTVGALGLLGILVYNLLLESLIPLREDWKKAGDEMLTSDIAHALLTRIVLAGAAALFPIAVLASDELVPVRGSLALWPVQIPYLLQILLFVFLADGVAYGLHRLTHEVSWLWPLHVVHHAPERLNALKAPRHHAVYMFIRYFVVFVPFVLIGAPPGVVIWYVPFLALFGPISHANADLRVPHWLDRIVVTPQVHQLHHCADMRLGNSNYAVIFPVWDIMFGTFSDPAVEKVGTVGVMHEPMPRGFLRDIVRPFIPRSRQPDS